MGASGSDGGPVIEWGFPAEEGDDASGDPTIGHVGVGGVSRRAVIGGLVGAGGIAAAALAVGLASDDSTSPSASLPGSSAPTDSSPPASADPASTTSSSEPEPDATTPDASEGRVLVELTTPDSPYGALLPNEHGWVLWGRRQASSSTQPVGVVLATGEIVACPLDPSGSGVRQLTDGTLVLDADGFIARDDSRWTGADAGDGATNLIRSGWHVPPGESGQWVQVATVPVRAGSALIGTDADSQPVIVGPDQRPYRVAGDGSLERLYDGVVTVVDQGRFVATVCDVAGDCKQVAVTPDGSFDLAAPMSQRSSLFSIAPDGSAIVFLDAEGSVTLQRRGDARPTALYALTEDELSFEVTATWTPDSSHVLVSWNAGIGVFDRNGKGSITDVPPVGNVGWMTPMSITASPGLEPDGPSLGPVLANTSGWRLYGELKIRELTSGGFETRPASIELATGRIRPLDDLSGDYYRTFRVGDRVVEFASDSWIVDAVDATYPLVLVGSNNEEGTFATNTWDPAAKAWITVQTFTVPQGVQPLGFGPQLEILLSGPDGTTFVVQRDGTFRRRPGPIVQRAVDQAVMTTERTPDGHFVDTVSTTSGTLVFPPRTAPVRDVAVNRAGTAAVRVIGDGEAGIVVRTDGGSSYASIVTGRRMLSYGRLAVWSPDGTHLVLFNQDGLRVYEVDLKTGSTSSAAVSIPYGGPLDQWFVPERIV